MQKFITEYGVAVDRNNDRLYGTSGVQALPEPRPDQHGFDILSWQDSPIYQLYGYPGAGRHPASHDH